MAQQGVEGGELKRFTDTLARGSARFEALSPFEHRLRWDDGPRSMVTHASHLRSGLALTTAVVRWEQSWRFDVDQRGWPLKFILTRGPGPAILTGGRSRPSGDGTFQVSRVRGPTRLGFDFPEASRDRPHEQLSLEVDPQRLRLLMGTDALPQALQDVLSSTDTATSVEQPGSSALFRVFDELVYCDAKGRSRPLHLEAKSLELLAVLIDGLEDTSANGLPKLTADCRDRLERAKAILLSRLDRAPTLPELARVAGLNEAKLKAGFRSLFGCTVHACLRRHRMEEARRLLLARRYSVSEVAGRVGYANPSKFAAAFRKHYGMPPSAVA